MKRKLIVVLAMTAAIPLAAGPAAAQQDWEERGRAYDDRGRYQYDMPGELSYEEWRARQYGIDRQMRSEGMSRDRWANRPTYDRGFDRPTPPPGYRGGDASRTEDLDRAYSEGYRAAEREARRSARGGNRTYYTDSQGSGPGYGDRRDGRSRYSQESRYEPMAERQRRRASRTIATFDADGDQRVTQKEIDDYRANRLKEFDENQDGQLSLEEYEKLWLDGMRDRMVDRFQDHDSDGDGRVTNDEFAAQTRDMVRIRDRDGDGAFSYGDLGPRGGAEFRRRHGQGQDRMAEPNEDYAGRPEVEAPLGGAPNDPDEPVAAEQDPGSESASQNTDETN